MSKNSTPEDQEAVDRIIIAETNKNIEEIINLIAENLERETVQIQVDSLKGDLNTLKTQSNKSVFHPYKGKRVKLNITNSKLLDLAESMKLQIITHSHQRDLQRALHTEISKQITALERQLKRVRK